MPKVKDIEKPIPKIYRRNFEDIAMFWYVKGQKDIVPAISIEKAMYNFFKAVCEEDYNIESAMTTYSRMQREFYENNKSSV